MSADPDPPADLAELAERDQVMASVRETANDALLVATYWKTLKDSGIPAGLCNDMTFHYQQYLLRPDCDCTEAPE